MLNLFLLLFQLQTVRELEMAALHFQQVRITKLRMVSFSRFQCKMTQNWNIEKIICLLSR